MHSAGRDAPEQRCCTIAGSPRGLLLPLQRSTAAPPTQHTHARTPRRLRSMWPAGPARCTAWLRC